VAKKNLIFLDTETSGVDLNRDFIIELACVRVNPDCNTFEIMKEDIFHTYLNPDCDIHAGSQKVHGISKEFLKDKPSFDQIVDSFLDFIRDDILVAHNAPFDINFLNKELININKPTLSNEVIDTLIMARKLYPGSQVGLDALRRRINMAPRGYHSALEDVMTLRSVYEYMSRPTQDDLFGSQEKENKTLAKYTLSNKLVSQNKIKT